ncbi:hypothetical protein P3T23_002308 [Paraburkholderia sp. GAS448]|uniref:hypothetical protein n=1 Tax=Paraburkholderia sp. GAS448 TaxID=3035136 RepID=UPI003D24BD71
MSNSVDIERALNPLFHYAPQHLAQFGVVKHWDDVQLHQIAPLIGELGEFLHIICFEQIEPCAQIGSRPPAHQPDAVRRGPAGSLKARNGFGTLLGIPVPSGRSS